MPLTSTVRYPGHSICPFPLQSSAVPASTIATVPARTPRWRRGEAAAFVSLGVGAGAVVVEGLPVPSNPVRVESATKLAATPVAFLQSLFGVVVPATKLTAAHFSPTLASALQVHCAAK